MANVKFRETATYFSSRYPDIFFCVRQERAVVHSRVFRDVSVPVASRQQRCKAHFRPSLQLTRVVAVAAITTRRHPQPRIRRLQLLRKRHIKRYEQSTAAPDRESYCYVRTALNSRFLAIADPHHPCRPSAAARWDKVSTIWDFYFPNFGTP